MSKSQPTFKSRMKHIAEVISENKNVSIPGAVAVLAVIGGTVFILNDANHTQKLDNTSANSANSGNTSQTSQEAVQSSETQKMNTDTTTTTKPAEIAPKTATQQNTEPPTPTKTIDVLTKEYAVAQGETDPQANCFSQIINYRTGWNISEEDMHAKYASIKATYPSMCAAWNVASARPADAPLKGM